MASREAILEAVRKNAPPERPLPDLSQLGGHFTDRPAQLEAAVGAVGGHFVRVADLAAADAALPRRDAAKRVSFVDGVGQSTIDVAALGSPHELEGLDVCVLPGELAVAENGAVWVEAGRLPHRAVYVIAEHLVLVVRAADVVDNLHEAYARLEGRERRFGLFISGPSKTADIEQALVIGAQGARTCTVILVG